MTEDEFYAALTERNRGLIPAATQRALQAAEVLVAGCGSTGGAAIAPLVRLGVGGLRLAEPGEYELNNLNRQDADLADLGRNKAAVGAERARAINPHLPVAVHEVGIDESNAVELVRGAAAVIDGVDVTTPSGWRGKYALHRAAAELGVPVVSGYDMSGTQYVRYYDYQQGLEPLDGLVTEDLLADSSVWDLLLRVIPPTAIPDDLRTDVRAHREDPDYSVPQLVYTSMLFGVLASRMVVEIVGGAPVAREVLVDVHQLVRPVPLSVG